MLFQTTIGAMRTPTTHPAERASEPLPGYNLFGYLTSNLGLGVAGRNTAELLLARGEAVRLVDVDPGGGMQGGDDSLRGAIELTRNLGPFAINVFHVNPDQILNLLGPMSRRVEIDGRLQVCVPFWELPRVPRSWIEPLSAMDAILAPTEFVRDAVLAALPSATVLHYQQTARVPADISPDRASFGIEPDTTAFVMSFDMRSDIERKNPWGTIEAFQRAFPDRPDVRLVIKANNVRTAAGLTRHLERLHAAADDPRIRVIDEPMDYRRILTLYASCDVLVSLHRAEGLGLSLLEAMALGVPVIATAWSGNMDFMTAENSCRVGYTLVPVQASTQPAYGKGTSGPQSWAEPDVGEAAEWMSRLAHDPALRASIGGKGRADAQRIRAEHDRGAVFDELARIEPDPEHRAMRRLRASYPLHQARRIMLGGWRRLEAALR
jgi:glycosyltransferase involved in cell wall biosynthesis